MNRRYFFAILAVALFSILFIILSMWQNALPPKTQTQDISHIPTPPFNSYIFGVGVVVASSENIFIGTPIQRIVEKVFVQVGQEIKKGDPLIRLENRDLEADLVSQEVAYKIAEAKLKKLELLPRKEDLEAAQAKFKQVQIELSLAANQYEMVKGLEDTRALSREEINKRRFNFEQAESRWQEAKTELEKLKAGAWQPDLEIAHLEVLQAETNLGRLKTDIERTIIRSPIDGKVLQIKIHEGEFPPLDTSKSPLMIVGNTEEKYLNVSINQYNASHFNPKSQAIAYLQGDARIEFPLEFIRIEPYLVNKENISHEITDKVDTKVLQIIYKLKNNHHHVFVGQQMDVFIETSAATREKYASED